MMKKTTKKQKETDIQKIVNYYFKTKGLDLTELKKNTRKKRLFTLVMSVQQNSLLN